jgi:hypothetical protein
VEWAVVVYGSDGKPVHSFGAVAPDAPSAGSLRRLFSRESSAAIPATLELRFRRSPAKGNTAFAPGRAMSTVMWGTRPSSTSFLDGTAPSAIARLEGTNVFSPNGDGTRDSLTVLQEGGSEALWTGTFRSADGRGGPHLPLDRWPPRFLLLGRADRFRRGPWVAAFMSMNSLRRMPQETAGRCA